MKAIIFKIIILLSLVFNSYSSYAWVNISEERQIQLDSIVTNIPKDIKRDLHKAHAYMHNNADNDEERVWMFFGYFPTHLRYDHKRKNDFKGVDYTPEYTIYRRSGVCRDFSMLFKKFCDMSNIPCMEVIGKSPQSIFQSFNRALHFTSNKTNHKWNIVKLNGEWQFMDPTWGSVNKKKRYYKIDKRGNKKRTASAKIIDRTYYDGIPDNMSRNHKAIHPAFNLLTKVPTYKTSFRKDSRRNYYYENYAYNVVLDSIWTYKYPELSKKYNTQCENYSKCNYVYYNMCNAMNYHKRKIPKSYYPTISEIKTHKIEVDSLSAFVLRENNINLEYEIETYNDTLNYMIKKIEKKNKKKSLSK